MIEVIQNCGQWIIDYLNEILLFISSIETISIVGTITALIRTKNTTSTNNKENVKLRKEVKSLSDTNESLVETVKTSTEENAKLKAELDVANKKLSEAAEKEDLILTKLDAMLNVQGVVYSTMKDPVARNTVTNIITNAKFAETNQRAKLKEELEKLKTEIVDKSAQVAKAAKEAVNKAEVIIDVNAKVDDTVIADKRVELSRY